MVLLNEEQLRILLYKDRMSEHGNCIALQATAMKCNPATLHNWAHRVIKYPNRLDSIGMRVLFYLQEHGYITIIIHDEPIKTPF